MESGDGNFLKFNGNLLVWGQRVLASFCALLFGIILLKLYRFGGKEVDDDIVKSLTEKKIDKKSQIKTVSAPQNESNSDSGTESASESESEISDTDEDSSTEEEETVADGKQISSGCKVIGGPRESVERGHLYGPKLVVFSGGTAFNSVVRHLSKRVSNQIAHILPISDNGGSSREIIRLLGGPAVGDIRSRLIRLVDDSVIENRSIKQVLEYRLPSEDSEVAKKEMIDIINGVHPIWRWEPLDKKRGVSPRLEIYKSTIKGFIVHFYECCRRAAEQGGEEFDFRGGSVGNFAFSGARLLFNSLDAAIYWFSHLAGVPLSSIVIPVINVNTRVTISATLMDGSKIIGQDAISHPYSPDEVVIIPPPPPPPLPLPLPPLRAVISPSLETQQQHLQAIPEEDGSDNDNDASSDDSNGDERRAKGRNGASTDRENETEKDKAKAKARVMSNQMFGASAQFRVTDKLVAGQRPLPSPILRIDYVNERGREVALPANPAVLSALGIADGVVSGLSNSQ